MKKRKSVMVSRGLARLIPIPTIIHSVTLGEIISALKDAVDAGFTAAAKVDAFGTVTEEIPEETPSRPAGA